MSESLFQSCRRRLIHCITLITRRSISHTYLSIPEHVPSVCQNKFVFCSYSSVYAGRGFFLVSFIHRSMGQFLEKPKVEKHNDRGKNDDVRYGLGSMQGWR